METICNKVVISSRICNNHQSIGLRQLPGIQRGLPIGQGNLDFIMYLKHVSWIAFNNQKLFNHCCSGLAIQIWCSTLLQESHWWGQTRSKTWILLLGCLLAASQYQRWYSLGEAWMLDIPCICLLGSIQCLGYGSLLRRALQQHIGIAVGYLEALAYHMLP